MMLTITTPDHLLYGSDYPYVASQVLTQSLQRMKQYLTTEPDLAPFREMILHKNAEWLLGMSQTKPVAESFNGKMIARLAEIEVYPKHLKEYLEFANEVDRLSKQGTLHMVKNLKLPTMQPLDPETMKLIFKKQR